MLRFHTTYFILTLFFLVIEILIALFLNDQFIRPYLGDMLVVVLMYCFIRAFFTLAVNWAIFLALGIAFIVEGFQYINLIQFLGLEEYAPAKIILGNTFSVEDLLMYLLGGIFIWINERFIRKRRLKTGLPNL